MPQITELSLTGVMGPVHTFAAKEATVADVGPACVTAVHLAKASVSAVNLAKANVTAVNLATASVTDVHLEACE